MGEEGGDGGACPLGDLDPADDISQHSKALAEKARAFAFREQIAKVGSWAWILFLEGLCLALEQDMAVEWRQGPLMRSTLPVASLNRKPQLR